VDDNGMFKHIIIVYCFTTVQLCKEDKNARMFSHHRLLLQFSVEHKEEEEEDDNAFKHVIII
jgi:hypothetical protein